jgi:iron complex transport system permease protein
VSTSEPGRGCTRRRALFALTLAAVGAIALGLAVGTVAIPPGRLLGLLLAPDRSVESTILWDLRLPRVLAAFTVGGALALAGALVQVLLRNPLGDPYVLGVSGGASAAVLGALLLGLPAGLHPAAAFAGAIGSTALVFALGRRGGVLAVDRLLLTGVVVAAGWAAVVSFALSLSPPAQLPGMLFFLMGDLADATTPWPPALALAAGLAVALPFARDLNLLALGDLRASALGVATAPLHLLVYLLSSLLTAVAVSTAGGIGFIGLVAPHLARLGGGSDHRWVLPGAALLGGILLTLADTAARIAIAPRQLPVGVLTALLGVPAFLVLLHGRR